MNIQDELHPWWDSYDDPYERLSDVANVLYQKNPEATFYDLLNNIREDIYGGAPYDDESDFIKSIDIDIEYEEKQSKLNGYK